MAVTWLVSINNIALGLWPILPVTWPVSIYDIALWCNQYYLWHDQSVILILHWGCDQYCLSHDQSVLMILSWGCDHYCLSLQSHWHLKPHNYDMWCVVQFCTYNFFFIYYCLDSQNMIVCYHGFWKTFLVDFV